jgi:hypothetical protein
LIWGKKGPHTAFIYSNLVKVGIDLFKQVLLQNGYIEYGDNRSYRGIKFYDKGYFDDQFVLCIIPRSYEAKVWKHLEWDKNRIKDYKGRYFYDGTEEQIKNYLKQHGES